MIVAVCLVVLTLATAADLLRSKNKNTVYITKNGSKYHTADCYILSDNEKPIDKKEAEKLGKEPRKICIN